jgi:hypothetical protein
LSKDQDVESSMNQKKKGTRLATVSNISHIAHKMKKEGSMPAPLELCKCLPLAVANQEDASFMQEGDTLDCERMVLISPALNNRLQVLLRTLFPRMEPLSLLVLHITQLESAPLAPHTNLFYKRRRYHSSPVLLEQVLTSVQRVIRVEDKMLMHEDTGVAIVFPGVDRQGVQIILERVYSSVCLLQSETLIPPLTRETTISLGIGTYPIPATSPDMLYQHVGHAMQCLVLRPVITAQLRGVKPMPAHDGIMQSVQTQKEELNAEGELAGIPFMDLPRVLPARLTQLLPFPIAVELRCAPVGRDHHCLTVAMLHPTDAAALRRLQLITGMTIFPVACDESALNSLLTRAW